MTAELTGRLGGACRAHDLVRPPSRKPGRAALLGDVISVLLSPYDDVGAFSGRIRAAVPRMGVGEAAATAVALAFHELATTSLKYGALSADSGTLDASGSTEENGEVTLSWIERGGPTVERAGSGTGYGTKPLSTGQQSARRKYRLRMGERRSDRDHENAGRQTGGARRSPAQHWHSQFGRVTPARRSASAGRHPCASLLAAPQRRLRSGKERIARSQHDRADIDAILVDKTELLHPAWLIRQSVRSTFRPCVSGDGHGPCHPGAMSQCGSGSIFLGPMLSGRRPTAPFSPLFTSV